MNKKQILGLVFIGFIVVVAFQYYKGYSEGFKTSPDKRFEGYSNSEMKVVCDQLKSQIKDYQDIIQKPAANEAEMQAQAGYKEAISKLESAMKENGC